MSRKFRSIFMGAAGFGGTICCLAGLFVWNMGTTFEPAFVSLKGEFLVATGPMGDPRFRKSVVYLIEHDGKGAMGLIVNKEMGEIRASELLSRMGDTTMPAARVFPLYMGGPVEIDQPFLLHTDDVMLESSIRVEAGVALSVDPDMLRSIAMEKGPRKYLLILGYSGWGPRQLEGELNRGDWVTKEAEPSLIFSDDPGKIWELLMEDQVFRL